MHEQTVRIIMAVEEKVLRDALLSALAVLDCSPEVILPQILLETELSGYNLIFLETSDDVERLVATAQQLWAKWGETNRASVQFLSYSTEDATTDSLVFRLWSIGLEMTVIVQTWRPGNLPTTKREAYSYTRRILEWKAA